MGICNSHGNTVRVASLRDFGFVRENMALPGVYEPELASIPGTDRRFGELYYCQALREEP